MHNFIPVVIGVFQTSGLELMKTRHFYLTVLIFHFFVSPAKAADIKLLYFYQQGCQWCEKFDETLKDATVADILARNTDIIRINLAAQRR
jgi:hypothetical protein